MSNSILMKKALANEQKLESKLNGEAVTDFFVLFKKGTWGVEQDAMIIKSESVNEAVDKLGSSSLICKNDALTEMLKDGVIEVGDVIAFPYSDGQRIETLLPFNICEVTDGKAIIHCRVALESVVFAESSSNDYRNSHIREHLARLTNRFDPSLWDHFKVKDVRYIDSKKQCFGHVSDKFWLLDIDELFTWYKTIGERERMYLGEGGDANWWLRHPRLGYVYSEYYVLPSGVSEINDTSIAFGCVPACLIG